MKGSISSGKVGDVFLEFIDKAYINSTLNTSSFQSKHTVMQFGNPGIFHLF